jgi:hypothetical protein
MTVEEAAQWPPPRPPRDLTLPSEMPAAPPLHSAGRGLPATGLAATVHRPPARPEAAAATACASTTPASVPRPRSARRAALTRKTNRLVAGPYTAAAAGPIQTCCKKLNFSTKYTKKNNYTGIAPPLCSPALGGWTWRNTASLRKNFSPLKKQVLIAAITHLGCPHCTWSPRRMGRGMPAVTTAA